MIGALLLIAASLGVMAAFVTPEFNGLTLLAVLALVAAIVLGIRRILAEAE